MATPVRNPLALKQVREIRHAPPRHWVGDGFPVRSLFTYDDAPEELSPFLLLDYAAPTRFAPSTGATDPKGRKAEPRGVGEHPHRGFETVSIAYQGEIEHRDSTGARGRIGPGDVQWMTAASGIVHEEKHSRAFTRASAKDKMSPPKYQDLAAARIPTVELPGGRARVIAGELLGTKGAASTFTPVDLWDMLLEKGRTVELPLVDGHTTALLVLSGHVLVNGSAPAGPEELVVLERRGDSVSLAANEASSVLLLGGEPIRERVVGYGPFVMNDEREIERAFADYQSGRMGHID
jgi:redox-sensitive bicupin YhaK (pirin superfamily)